MLLPAEAVPLVESVAKLEAHDPDSARELVRIGLFEALSDLVDDAREEINSVWKRYAADRSEGARRELVKVYVDRRLTNQGVDDVVKAAAGVALIDGYVAKASGESLEEYNRKALPAGKTPKDARGRFARFAGHVDRGGPDMMRSLTERNDQMREGAEGVAEQLQGRRYDRMRVVGNALAASGHPNAVAAGQLTRAAAEIGPSAQQVLEPGIRRAAYRYRGTEKTPDNALLLQNRVAVNLVREGRAPETVEPGNIGAGAARFAASQRGWSEDQQAMSASSDVATGYLLQNEKALPTLKELELSQAAGRTPPSVGVMIDRDGDIVSQAQGFNGDHYLPFDLKNLKRLAGGQYVRTRALGGPTNEDIYTGLLTGARQMRVVSRSGVFTIEFQPDLRGGRRYSDKARQMVDRYTRLVDVVANAEKNGLFAEDIPESRKQALFDSAMRATDFDEEAARPIYMRKLREARAIASQGYDADELRGRAESEVDAWAAGQQRIGHNISTGERGRQIDQRYSELVDEARSQARVRALKLNGEGYKRAMDSLAREFPYYIRRVDWEPLPDFEVKRSLLERGQPPSPRNAPPAKDSHVSRGRVEEKIQARAYERTNLGQKKKTAASGTEEGGDEAAAAATTPGGPKPSDSGGGAQAPLAAEIQKDAFVRHFGQQLNKVRGLGNYGNMRSENFLGVDLEIDGKMPKEADDVVSLGPEAYTVWLFATGNPKTRGDVNRVADYLIKEATPDEIELLHQGLETASDSFDHALIQGSKVPEIQQWLEFVSDAKQPFGGGSGKGALYVANANNPRPYGFPDVPSGTDEKLYVAWGNRAKADPMADSALKWVGTKTNKTIQADLAQQVDDYNGAIEWGARRAEQRKAQEELDITWPNVSSEISGPDADDIYQQKENSRLYKQLEARQRAWAFRHAQQMLQRYKELTGGGAAPKVEKRLRRVTVHRPDDPMSVALSKRLARGSMSFGARA